MFVGKFFTPRNWLTLKRVTFFFKGKNMFEASIIWVVGSNIVYITPKHGEMMQLDLHIFLHYIALLFVHFCFQSGQNRTARGPKRQRIVGISSHSWYISPWLVYHLVVGISSHS